MTAPLQLFIDRLHTPIGTLVIVADGDGSLRAVDWSDYDTRLHTGLRRRYGAKPLAPRRDPGGCTSALAAYFAGDLTAVGAVPVAPAGTPFQQTVWAELRRIAPGATASYAELARRIGQPRACRAVGLANGANPIGIVIPCHRVIGADGSLTGYGGGLARKRWLLAHEAGIATLPFAAAVEA